MKITPALKSWLVENAGLAATADEATCESTTLKAMIDGNLTREKLVELTADPDAKRADSLEDMLTNVLTKLNQGQGTEQTTNSNKAVSIPDLGAAIANAGTDGESTASGVRVKSVTEMYDTTRRAKLFPMTTNKGTRHPFAGMPMAEGDGATRRFINEHSQLDLAISGAFVKFSVQRLQGLPTKLRMTEHDQALIQYAIREYEWGGVLSCGTTGDSATKGAIEVFNRKLRPSEYKAILDDSTSGGLEVAPIVFDDMIITTPLLYGEFYPSVNVVPITRGRRIEGASFGNVTIQSGGADDSDIDLFNTTAFIAAFDTNIHVADAGIEIGLDFLSDSPIDVVGVVVDSYSRALLAWLDEQIVQGDGTTEPEGITVSSGTTSVAGGATTPTVGVYESFFFGVPKRYKQGYPAERIMFGANETTYMRARAIKVGASDERRIFGMTHGDYMLMGHKYGISDAMANTRAFFCNMARYRMYRRLGMTIRSSTEGKTLMRGNKMLITCRSRWGGQLEDGASASVSTTMQA